MGCSIMEKALSAAGIAVLVLDDADRIVDISQPAAGLLGYDRADLIGKPASVFLPVGHIRSVVADAASAKQPGVPAEITARDKAGRELPVAVSAVRWAEPGGNCLTTVVIHDIASEKEVARIAHSQLVQSDNAIRGAGIGVFEYDPVADSVSVSDIWRRSLELEPGEQIDVQKEWRDRVHPADLDAALEPVQLCAEGKAERASCEYRLHSRDRGRWRWMRTDIAVAQRDATGRPSLLVGAQSDITERKETEEALRVSVERFRAAFYNAPIGKALVGLDGKWWMVNAALRDLLGYSESEFLSTDFQTLTHPDDREADLRMTDLLIAGQIPSYTLEKRFFRANGSIMWGQMSVSMIRDADGKPDHFVSWIVDITEQRRLDELKNEFVSVVSHEMRTPLTSILGALSLLEFDDDAQFSDEVQRLVFIAKKNGERLLHLINDTLDFQKFTARQMEISLAPHPAAVLVEEALLAGLALTDKYGVRFSPQIKDRSLMMLVDPKRFHQVMANLLSNAAKFADPGSVVEVSAELQGATVRVSVSNTGQGIPDAFRERVFQPFSQAVSMSDRSAGGTGLGLSIVKQIVEQMGGEIGFTSVPGEVTTFWFTVRTGEKVQ